LLLALNGEAAVPYYTNSKLLRPTCRGLLASVFWYTTSDLALCGAASTPPTGPPACAHSHLRLTLFRLPPRGSEALHVCFPFAAYGSAQCRAALGQLPQAHTCTNTLELPDYCGALARLEREGAGADAALTALGCSTTGGGGGAAQQRLLARCREVLRERLAYAVANCGGVYGLDE
jgi:hypothetical protein